MERSTNLNLYLPGNSDYRDVNQLSYNFETLDDAIVGCKLLKLTKSSVSSLPTTISNANITAKMECIKAVLSNQNAQRSDWTVNTSAGSVEVTGTISGTTNITLYLEETV